MKIVKIIFERRFNIFDWFIMVFVGHFIKEGKPFIMLSLVFLWFTIDELAKRAAKEE